MGAIQGIIADLGLTELGKRQVKNLKSVVKEFAPDFVISSPLKRALETAEILTEENKLEIEINDLLTEMSFQNLQIIDKSELKKFNEKLDQMQGYIEENESNENGESHNNLKLRVKKFWIEFKKRNSYKNSKFIIIAHGRVLTFFISYIMDFRMDGYRFAIPNAGFLKLII